MTSPARVPVRQEDVPLHIDARCIAARVAQIEVSTDGRGGQPVIREVNYPTDGTAVIASVRNVSTNGVNAEDVTAHLKLYDANRKELLTGISKLCWLNSVYEMVDINVEETEHVVLLVRKGGNTFIPFKKCVTTSSGDYLENGKVIAPPNLAMIEVTVLNAWNRKLLPSKFVNVSVETSGLCASTG